MESLQNIVDNAGFPDGKCFCYGEKYLNNETNKVILLFLAHQMEKSDVFVG